MEKEGTGVSERDSTMKEKAGETGSMREARAAMVGLEEGGGHTLVPQDSLQKVGSTHSRP